MRINYTFVVLAVLIALTGYGVGYTATVLPVFQGGTGKSSFTAYGLVSGGTTSTSPLQSLALGDATQVLTSNGAGALPSWEDPASGSDNYTVMVSADDTTPGYLEGKIQADHGVDVTTYSPGANEIFGIAVDEAELDHGLLGGLSDDDHTQYAKLLGRAGGQTLIGGTASGDDLILESTSNATKGDVRVGVDGSDLFLGLINGNLGALTFDYSEATWYFRNSANQLTHAIELDAGITAFNEAGADMDFRVQGDNDTNLLKLDAGLDKVGIGVATPSQKLDVEGPIATADQGATPSYTADRGTWWSNTSDKRPYFVSGGNTLMELAPIYKDVFWVAQDRDGSGTSTLPYAIDAGQGAMIGMANYANRVTFDATKGLTDAYGDWSWIIQTDPFYMTCKISVGAPFRWYTTSGLTGSATRCKTARVGCRIAVSDNAHFDSVKLKLTDGTNTSQTTLTPTSTMTDYWSAAIDVSGWANVTYLRVSVVFDGDDGEAADTPVYCDVEYLQVELWGA